MHQDERYPLCRWSGIEARAAAASLIAAGRAFELYQRWRPLADESNEGALPVSISPAILPPISVAPLRSRFAQGAT
jgi:hypothetical protein